MLLVGEAPCVGASCAAAVHVPGAGLARGEPLARVENALTWSYRPDHELHRALAIDSLPPIWRDALLMRDSKELASRR